MMNTGNSEFRTISKSGRCHVIQFSKPVFYMVCMRFVWRVLAELEEELNRYKRAVLGGASGGGVSAVSSGYSSLPQSLASTLGNGASTSLSGTSVGSQSAAAAAAAAASGVGTGGGGLSSISALMPNSISGISSSLSSHALQSMNAAAYGGGQSSVEKLLSGTSGITGIPPLPVNIHTMKAMPTALSQVNQLFSIAMNYKQQKPKRNPTKQNFIKCN